MQKVKLDCCRSKPNIIQNQVSLGEITTQYMKKRAPGKDTDDES